MTNFSSIFRKIRVNSCQNSKNASVQFYFILYFDGYRRIGQWRGLMYASVESMHEFTTEDSSFIWLPGVLLTQIYQYPVNLLLYWKPDEDKPWLLATNLTSARTARRSYQRGMWIDEIFGDFKGHGADLEAFHLRHFMRLSRLTLAVAMLYVWLGITGSSVINWGLCHLIGRKDRRDFSIFRIRGSFI